MCHFARSVRPLDYLQLKATARHQLMQKVKVRLKRPIVVARRHGEALSLLHKHWLATRLCGEMLEDTLSRVGDFDLLSWMSKAGRTKATSMPMARMLPNVHSFSFALLELHGSVSQ